MNSLIKKSLIIVDSCCELASNFKTEIPILKVPFNIFVNNKEYTDDENINVNALLDDMKASEKVAKSSCPSPQAFLDIMEKMSEKTNIFVVTLSSKMSGAYNSAIIAKNQCLDECKEKCIHVFDSLTASAGEMNVVMKINECIKNNLSHNETIDNVTKYIDNLKTTFILQNFDNLIKNGRMSKAKAMVANVLGIVPIMIADNGEIGVEEKVRGMNKALNRIVERMQERNTDFKNTVLSITHCNALKLAETVKELVIEKGYEFKDIIINTTAGLSTLYANDGGIIISY